MAVLPSERPSVAHYAKASPQDKEAVEKVAACVLAFEGGIGPDFKDQCERRYKQYRGFRKFANAWEQGTANDRDMILADSKEAWGANLHIPLSFRTIETMVPRAIANAPHMLYMPRSPEWEKNVDTVRLLIDSQQEQIDIDLRFQDVMRAGRIYGLGPSKVLWRTEYSERTTMKRKLLRPGEWVPTKGRVCDFDDPDFVDVDVFDFMWDPMGSATAGQDRAKWIVHRFWLDLDGCLQRIRSGTWNTDSAKALAADPHAESVLRGIGNGQKYSEVWQTRMEASGFSTLNLNEGIHEVWEWHDGQRVLTVLDRTILVQDAENPVCGMLPFGVYRPTPLQKQMVGIGDLEPLEHIQRELDTLRSQRRDAATLALCAGYAYDDSMIDEEDLVFGPAAAIRVRNSGDIRNALMPLQVRDVPGSAVAEEQMIRADFDAVSGISDALDSSGGSSGTATEAQLVQASLSHRIQLGSRRFEIETVRHGARGFLRLNQRMITGKRHPIRQPAEGYDVAGAAKAGRWQWFDVDPGTMEGEFEIIPEGGSMAARNIPQDRQDAQMAMDMFKENPYIDPKRPLLFALKKLGLSQQEAQAWLKQSDPPVPPKALEILGQMGVDPAKIQFAVKTAQRGDPQLGPNVEQVDQLMGGGQGER